MDLDSVPPEQSTDASYDAVLFTTSGSLFGGRSGGPDVAPWPGPGTPGRKECVERLATHGSYTAEVTRESVLCLRTQTGRVAALTITDMGDLFTDATVEAVVWEARDSA
ncbi:MULTISPECIES: hypothetical protein [unclassified Streptomyces]|uniref:hypothetical protein n=1 Tax=unclassified Streptomyces TaxID=2593676 RepID=UPI0022384A1D|nr:hypothetical protein [Streptomyces sp. SHP 1-2]MCW5251231.1 hypothetical protein [Streptomyces sp. SHP 1-2]